MTREEVLNEIISKIPDNKIKSISPQKLREAIIKVIDYAEYLELGESITDLDNRYAAKSNTYTKDQVDAIFSEIESSAPFINEDYHWVVSGEDTGVNARGVPGETPYVGENGNWWVGDTDTSVPARGEPGENPYIGENGNWWVGDTDTGVPATDPNVLKANGDYVISGNFVFENPVIVPESANTGAAVPLSKVISLINEALSISTIASRFKNVYEGEFSGIQDGSNKVFVMPSTFISGTVEVFKSGIRLSRGGALDFIESTNHAEGPLGRTVVLVSAPTADHRLSFRYIESAT